eukprot:TCALIF_06824-PA protein Name:"Similar to Prss2 Anionic trypsin-2 (Rattus norvegicus)" AED:0.07 eAED:0.07 QI:97/0.5/0.6/1/0/0.2/5/232/202
MIAESFMVIPLLEVKLNTKFRFNLRWRPAENPVMREQLIIAEGPSSLRNGWSQRLIVPFTRAWDMHNKNNSKYLIDKLIIHDYDEKTKIGDIALIKLKLEGGQSAGTPLKLAPSDFDPTGQSCLITGWGHLKSHENNDPERLQEAKGDSGGPLACQKDGEYLLTGIVSWGVGCATEGMPGIYTNVRNYLDWINSTMEANKSS